MLGCGPGSRAMACAVSTEYRHACTTTCHLIPLERSQFFASAGSKRAARFRETARERRRRVASSAPQSHAPVAASFLDGIDVRCCHLGAFHRRSWMRHRSRRIGRSSPISSRLRNFDAAFAGTRTLHEIQMGRNEIVAGSALIAGVSAGVGTGIGMVAAARGNVGGAPGISKALSRIGRYAGGGMLAGVGVVAGASALSALIVYQGLTQADELVRTS